MKSPVIAVTVTDANTGDIVHTETRRAPNAGRLASEAAVRAIARAEGQTYTGAEIVRVGHIRTRLWTGDRAGRVLIAKVEG